MFRLIAVGSVRQTGGKAFDGNLLHLFRDCAHSTAHGSKGLSNNPNGSAASANDDLTSSEKLTVAVDRTVKSRQRLEQMRSRMRQLHGLDFEGPSGPSLTSPAVGLHEPVSPSNHREEDETQSTAQPVVHDDGSAKRQSRFLRRIGNGQARKKHTDQFIAASFGLVRIDGMNKLHGSQKGESHSNLSNTKDGSEAAGNIGVGAPEISPGCRTRAEVKRGSKLKSPDCESFRSKYGFKQNQELEESSRQPNFSFSQKSSKQTPEINLTQAVQNNDTELLGQSSTLQNKSNIFDEQYFDEHVSNSVQSETNVKPPKTLKITSTYDNVIEDQYFGNSNPSLGMENAKLSSLTEDFPVVDYQGMSTTSHRKVESPGKLDADPLNLFEAQFFQQDRSEHQTEHAGGNKFGYINQMKTSKQMVTKPLTSQENDSDDTIFHAGITRREIKKRETVIANVENPTTAYDVAMKIRLEKKGKLNDVTESTVHPNKAKWSGRVDHKGFRLLDDQIVDVQYMTNDAVLNVLKDSVLYEDDSIIAIDKPYGLPSHGGPGIHQSIGKFLAPLAAKLDRTGQLETLHLVHRLDKETTGVMVLAKSQQCAEMLLAMFKKRMVVKSYWAITKGIPNPTHGVIDIPMVEGTVQGRYRMELRPVYTDNDELRRNSGRVFRDRLEAVTNFKVLSSAYSAALVECQPETGVKHQIRCHLAFGLNTPILGDHKFSHYSKLAPQKLYPEILQRLGIRQSKARHLPMHLHAKTLILPEFRDGRNLFLSANLPKHFVQSMKWLKLNPTS